MSLKAWELRQVLAGLDDEAAVVLDFQIPGHKWEQQLYVDSARGDTRWKLRLAGTADALPCKCRPLCDECGGSGLCPTCDDGDCVDCDGTGRK